MPRIAEQAGPVTGGAGTHADVHVAAVVDQVGRVLGTQACPATAAGYRAALAWMRAHGELVKVGVEGTGSSGAGLARYLAAGGIEVAEVIRPDRQARRQRGKSDAADAVAATVAALSGEASGMPKSGDGAAGSIQALRMARAGAVKARTPAGHQLRDLILTAPEPLHQHLAGQPCGRQADVAARFRPGGPACPAGGAKAAMASVARRHQQLTTEITRLDTMPEELVRHAARNSSWPTRAWPPGPPPRCWSPPGTTPAGCAARPASPRCAAPARSMPPPASSSATGSTAAATGRPTPRCGRSP
jgi:transposase